MKTKNAMKKRRRGIYNALSSVLFHSENYFVSVALIRWATDISINEFGISIENNHFHRTMYFFFSSLYAVCNSMSKYVHVRSFYI